MPHLLINERGEIRHSDEMQDIITAPPSWLMNWGITGFSGILVAIIGLSALIKYPDVVKTHLTIIAANVPVPVMARTTGRLVKVLIENNQEVNSGEPLAYIASTVSHEQVLALLKHLYLVRQRLRINKLVDDSFLSLRRPTDLGELQPAYQTFQSSFIAWETVVSNGSWSRKQLKPNHQTLVLNTKLIKALNFLTDQVEIWKSRYVLTAPQTGKIVFAVPMQEGQILQNGHDAFYIYPANAGPFFGQMIVPQNSISKVKPGQQVLVKLRNYPFEEYGLLKGEIKSVADTPFHEGVYYSTVTFDISKETDLHKSVNLKQGMVANAEIITENATVMQRIIYSLFKTIQRK